MLSDIRVDDDGAAFAATDDVLCNVSFDGRRIWSFWSVRDSAPSEAPVARTIAWPERLTLHLVGVTRLGVALGDGTSVLRRRRSGSATRTGG